jgi:hypothetical protein
MMKCRNEGKLPLWAQSELEKLRANVAHWKGLANAVAGEHGETDACIEGLLGEPDRGLPPGSTVTFKLGPEHHDRVRVKVLEDFDGVKYLRVMGASALFVKPAASNVVEVYDDEDRRWRERKLRADLAKAKK